MERKKYSDWMIEKNYLMKKSLIGSAKREDSKPLSTDIKVKYMTNCLDIDADDWDFMKDQSNNFHAE